MVFSIGNNVFFFAVHHLGGVAVVNAYISTYFAAVRIDNARCKVASLQRILFLRRELGKHRL